MKKSDFARLGKVVMDGLPGFCIKGSLLFRCPFTWCVEGIHFDSASHDPLAFYVDIFLLPLCVPTQHLHVSFGTRVRRISGSDRWSAEDPSFSVELQQQIETSTSELFKEVKSPLEIAVRIPAVNRGTQVVGEEATAFMYARGGDRVCALAALEALEMKLDPTAPWKREMLERVRHLQGLVRNSPVQAQQQLAAWEEETVQNLGLARHWIRQAS